MIAESLGRRLDLTKEASDNYSKTVIWVDADACPRAVKEVVFKASERRQLRAVFVANQFQQLPKSLWLSFVKVDSGFDVADAYIIQHAHAKDLVITQDIPLAALLVEKGIWTINPRGEVYSEESVREKLSMRDFAESLRSAGQHTGGPPSFNAKDKQAFANSFDSLLTRLEKKNMKG